MNKNLRTATKEDFKVGTTLIMSEGWEFTIMRKYDDGIWEARGNSGDKCVFENEAHTYKVENNMNLLDKFDSVEIENTLNIPQNDIDFCVLIDNQYKDCITKLNQWKVAISGLMENMEAPDFIKYDIRYEHRGKEVFKTTSQWNDKSENSFNYLQFSPLYSIAYIDTMIQKAKLKYIQKLKQYFGSTYNITLDFLDKTSLVEDPDYNSIVKNILDEIGTTDLTSIGIENFKEDFRRKFSWRNEIKITPFKLQIPSFMYLRSKWSGGHEFSYDGNQTKLGSAFAFFDKEDLKASFVNNFNGDVDFSEPYPIIGNSKVESIKFYKNGKVDIKFYHKDGPQEFYDFYQLYKIKK